MEDYLKKYDGHCLTCKNYSLNKNHYDLRGYRCTSRERAFACGESCSRYEKDYRRTNREIQDAIDYLNYRGYEPRSDSDCYITTIVCDILGLDDKCEYLTNFRKIRDDYMIYTNDGIAKLVFYDMYGSKAAQKLLAMYNNSATREYALKEARYIENSYFREINKMIKSLFSVDEQIKDMVQRKKHLENALFEKSKITEDIESAISSRINEIKDELYYMMLDRNELYSIATSLYETMTLELLNELNIDYSLEPINIENADIENLGHGARSRKSIC